VPASKEIQSDRRVRPSTNEEGHITRWDWFIDPEKWNQLLGVIGLDPEGFTSREYTVNVLREGRVGG
jgi:hypothetical protein